MFQGNSFQEADSQPHRRIEVNRIFAEDGTSHVLVQDMSYGPGVGWYPQKTIRLDGEQVEALLQKLCCEHSSQRGRKTPLVQAENWAAATPEDGAEVIPFPR